MTLDYLKKLVQDVAASGATPRTILLTPEDATSLKLPFWTRQLWGLKVVIAQNIEYSKVVPHLYESVSTKKSKEEIIQ